jgi:hypothetical protein
MLHAWPQVFLDHEDYCDRAIVSYLVYERLKGADSWLAPYFEALCEPEILSDWSDRELEELQDPFLVYNVRSSQAQQVLIWMARDWAELKEAYEAFPQFFSGVTWDLFYWAFKAFKTRCFEWAGFRMVPLADSLNHANVNVVYEVRSESFLTEACTHSVDYSDFSGISTHQTSDMPRKTCRNRLQKFFDSHKPLPDLLNIWDIEDYLGDYSSSSDEACSDDSSEEEEEEEEEDEEKEEGQSEASSEEQAEEEIEEEAGMFFVMRTRLHCSFLEGSQVFNCYGRLPNADLLLNYGFVMHDNEYDSFDLRVSPSQLWRDVKSAPHILQFVQEQAIAKRLASKKPGAEYAKIPLKLNKLNFKLLSFFRKNLPTLNAKEPTCILTEQTLMRNLIDFLETLHFQRRTTLRRDTELLASGLTGRLKSAVAYRIRQTQILSSQTALLKRVLLVLKNIANGQSARSACLPGVSIQTLTDFYPLRQYLQKLESNRRQAFLLGS